MDVSFDVEQAGCESCASRVRAALQPYGSVESVELDEAADIARVVLRVKAEADEQVVDRALADASVGAGHRYRVRPGSWRE